MTKPLLITGICGLSLLAAEIVSAGFACRSACGEAGCEQPACSRSATGPGYCICGSGAALIDGSTYVAWCRASGAPDLAIGCSRAQPDGNPGTGNGIPPFRIDGGDPVTTAVAVQNVYVAALLSALRVDDGWSGGAVDGLLSEGSLDEQSTVTWSGLPVRFAGQVTTSGLGTVQIAITFSGDLSTLGHLHSEAQSRSPAGVVPVSISGSLTDQGVHGSLVAADRSGRTQALSW